MSKFLALATRSIVPVLLTAASLPAQRPQGTQVGFAETFALSKDRQKALEQLIPGTQDYYYYHCLHYQNTGRLEEVDKLLATWIQRRGRNSQVETIENRQAILRFGDDPKGSATTLISRLGLSFGHQRERAGEVPNVPTRLAQSLVSAEAFERMARREHPKTVDGFSRASYRRLATSNLDENLLVSLLGKLEHPDIPNLPSLVVRELDRRRSRGFGSFAIHKQMLLSQLESCVRLKPELINNKVFVETYLRRLLPSADADWQRDGAVRQAFLTRLQQFADRVGPTHNSLKAHVLYHQMKEDLATGQPSQARLISYLRLPHRSSYANPKRRERQRNLPQVRLDLAYPTGLETVGNDVPVVREYLRQLLAPMDSPAPFEPFVDARYLRRLFAEIKILAGTGDMERWYSMLDDPGYYEELRKRVDLEFATTQRRHYGPTDKVQLTVDVKNAPVLLLKVYEIDTEAYYQAVGKEIDASIGVDGLVPNVEQTFRYDDNALRRVRRTYDLPQLNRPGVYVVDLIGNGRSSRAVIHKGRLRWTERHSSAGQVVSVFDDAGKALTDATIRFAGRIYRADEEGEILLPFSTKAGRKPMILRHGNRATLATLSHRQESYKLKAAAFIDRESLLSGARATLLVRPHLELNGESIAIDILEDPVLTLTSNSLDGRTSSIELRDLELTANGEFVHEIGVPDRVLELTAQLSGRVKILSSGKRKTVSHRAVTLKLNDIEQSPETRAPLMTRTPEGWVLEIRGKNGEPRANHAREMMFARRGYAVWIRATLKTDEEGRIHLGRLEDVSYMNDGSKLGYWDLQGSRRTLPEQVFGTVGSTLRVPLDASLDQLTRDDVALVEMRGGNYCRDAFQNVALGSGELELRNLPAGDYELELKHSGHTVDVRVTDGVTRGTWALGAKRFLEVDEDPALTLGAMELGDKELTIRLGHANDTARVHVFATRYVAGFDPFTLLSLDAEQFAGARAQEFTASDYRSGRDIGDEYRYILERRYAQKFPGNMLDRPGLLLNPWALDERWNSAIGLGGGAGGAYGGRSGGAKRRKSAKAGEIGAGGIGTQRSAYANLDFLPRPSAGRINLTPDANGIVTVPLADLGEGHMIHVVAVQGTDTIYSSAVRAETKLKPRSRTLTKALPANRHVVEQRRIEFLNKGDKVELRGGAHARSEIQDSFSAAFRMLDTLSSHDLSPFAFLLKWPTYDDAKKRELYSQHACHELNFFLHQKDRGFFEAAVKPYLVNKAHPTFMDDWLLERDLTRYLDGYAFARLNIAEKILLSKRLAARSTSLRRHVGELQEARMLEQAYTAKVATLFEDLLAHDALEVEESPAEESESAFDSNAWNSAVGASPSKKPKGGRGGGRRPSGPTTPGAGKRPGGPAAPGPADKAADGKAEEKQLRRGRSRNLDRSLKDAERREQAGGLYRAPDKTKQYAEHNYFRRGYRDQGPGIIRVNRFWRDYAEASEDRPFVSKNLAEAAGTVAEMMFALAVLDLPWAAGEHKVTRDGDLVTMEPAGPLLLVRRELADTGAPVDGAPILVNQNLYRLDARYRVENGRQVDNFVTGEFLVDVAYGCQVVITNPTSSPRSLEAFLQIPEGAVPVKSGFYQRGRQIALPAFGTTTIDYAFYFPAEGKRAHYPVHIGEGGKLLAFADARDLPVVRELAKVDTTSWNYVSQNGTNADVLNYLRGANIQLTDLKRIAWRMRDGATFQSVLAMLRQRHAQSRILWSYGLLHRDPTAVGEYLRQSDNFLRRCGGALESELITVDPVERLWRQHVEFEPLINGRAHRFGATRTILDPKVAGQHMQLVRSLCGKAELNDLDRMAVTYYMLLQGRVAEALEMFASVRREGVDSQLQYDYMKAYMAFFADDPSPARAIAQRYKDHPVKRWRERFGNVLAQLDEIRSGEVLVADESRTSQQTASAAKAPGLDMTVEALQMKLQHRNVDNVELAFYRMDVEALFSTTPFVDGRKDSFAFIRPHHTMSVPIGDGKATTTVALPQQFHNANVVIEARAGGLVRRQTYYSNSLHVDFAESFGMLQARRADDDKPLSRVYVKVYAKLPGGAVRFHKDGYTDHRGRFDYVSLTGDGAGGESRFAVLVMSDAHGATIREVDRPVR